MFPVSNSLPDGKCYHLAGTFPRNRKNKYNCRMQLYKQSGLGRGVGGEEEGQIKILILTKTGQISNSGVSF